MATSTPQSVVFIPTITDAGKAAALAASNNGLALTLDAVSFGTGAYTPTGKETALVKEIKRVKVGSSARVTNNQIRMTSVWPADTSTGTINEVAFWAGNVLFAVWSRTTGPLGSKTSGVAFVLVNDISFDQLPSSSLTVSVDPDSALVLAMLAAHEAATNPHPNYVLISTVDSNYGGTAQPLMDGTSKVGASKRFAREDHVHPTDTTRAPVEAPSFTGPVSMAGTLAVAGMATLAAITVNGAAALKSSLSVAGAAVLSGTLSVAGLATLASATVTGALNVPTQAVGNNTTLAASTAFVSTAIANLINSAPGALDTLNELADAIGDDPNFAATMTNALALKAPLASPSFTGTVNMAGSLALAGAATLSNNLTVNGTTTLNGWAYINSDTVLWQPATATNARFEIGYVGGAATSPYIDFHSGATVADFDSRLMAGGGDGTSGGGFLSVRARCFALGTTTSSSVALYIRTDNQLTSSNYGVYFASVWDPTVATTQGIAFASRPAIADTAGTIGFTYGFQSTAPTFNGANAAIGEHMHFQATAVGSTAIGKAFGFRGQLNRVDGKDRWNLFADGTAPNHMMGNLLIGTTADIGGNLQVVGQANVQGSGNAWTMTIQDTGANGATLKMVGNGSATPGKYLRVKDGSFQIINSAYGATIFSLNDNGSGQFAGEVQTTAINSYRQVYGNYGTFWRNDGSNLWLMLTSANDQYGGYNALRPFRVNLADGTVTFGHAVTVAANASVSGTFQAGNVAAFAGAPIASSVSLNVGPRGYATAAMTGTSQRGVNVQLNYGPDCTSTANDFRAYSSIGDGSTSATLGQHIGYVQEPLAIGSNQLVTNHTSYLANDQPLVALANAYGFYGSMNTVSGKNRWNLYMGGSAPNYLAGKVLIGTATDDGSGSMLQLNGNMMSINTSGNVKSLLIRDEGAQGAAIQLYGNGSTPGKYLRSKGGNFEVVNSAFNSVLLTLTDAGFLTTASGATFNGNANVTGTFAVKGQTTLSDGGFVFTTNSLAITPSGMNAGIELGDTRGGSATTPFLDWHSGATAVDYDFRMLASGGDGTVGNGTMTFTGNAFYVNAWTTLNRPTTISYGSGSAYLNINGVSGNYRHLRLSTAGTVRWDVGATNDAESSGNVGSNFYVNRFADDGSYLDTPFAIIRSTGLVNVGQMAIATTITMPTQARTDSSTKGATTAFVRDAISVKGVSVRFVANGTWTCPAGVTQIYVSACAGGGGGAGGGGYGQTYGAGGGGGGGAGTFLIMHPLTVTPGMTYTIGIGAGGNAGTGGTSGNGGNSGVSGGSTTMKNSNGNDMFSPLVGGAGATGGSLTSGAGGIGGYYGGEDGGDARGAGLGGDGGSGGSGPFGTAGGGGRAGNNYGVASKPGLGYGCGGGGGGASWQSSGDGGNGTAGMPGFLMIQY